MPAFIDGDFYESAPCGLRYSRWMSILKVSL